MKKLLIALLLGLSLVSCETETNISYMRYTKELKDSTNIVYQKDTYLFEAENYVVVRVLKVREMENYQNLKKFIYNAEILSSQTIEDTIKYEINAASLDSNNNFIYNQLELKVINDGSKIVDIIE